MSVSVAHRPLGFPRFSFVSNFQWHTDNSYEEEPAAATWLYVNRLPENGGKTSLTNMIAAYDALPAATQRRIDGLVAPHYTGPGILGDHMSEVTYPLSICLLATAAED